MRVCKAFAKAKVLVAYQQSTSRSWNLCEYMTEGRRKLGGEAKKKGGGMDFYDRLLAFCNAYDDVYSAWNR